MLIRLEIILTNLRGRVNRVSHKKIAAGDLVWYNEKNEADVWRMARYGGQIMIKKLYRTLNVIVYSFAGALIGNSIYTYYDYKTHPDLYEMQSAPWYAAIQANVILFLITALVIFAVRWILRKKYGELLNS